MPRPAPRAVAACPEALCSGVHRAAPPPGPRDASRRPPRPRPTVYRGNRRRQQTGGRDCQHCGRSGSNGRSKPCSWSASRRPASRHCCGDGGAYHRHRCRAHRLAAAHRARAIRGRAGAAALRARGSACPTPLSPIPNSSASSGSWPRNSPMRRSPGSCSAAGYAPRRAWCARRTGSRAAAANRQRTADLRSCVVATPEDLGVRRIEASRTLLAACSIDDLVAWSEGLYRPPARFRGW